MHGDMGRALSQYSVSGQEQLANCISIVAHCKALNCKTQPARLVAVVVYPGNRCAGNRSRIQITATAASSTECMATMANTLRAFSRLHTSTVAQICRKITGVEISRVKPSHCFTRLEQLVLPSIFDTSLSSFITWNLQSIIQQQFWMKECDILGGQNILWRLHISRGQDLPTPRIYAFVPLHKHFKSEAANTPGPWTLTS